MNLLKNLFGGEKYQPKTGVYIPESNDLVELDELPGNGSIVAIIEGLNYPTNYIHTVHSFDHNISVIGFKIFTDEVVFALAENDKKRLTMKSLNKTIQNIDWGFEYAATEVENILDEGIEKKNLTFTFLNSVLALIQKNESTYHAATIDLLLYFDNNILVNHSSTDGLTAESKWLKNLHPELFYSMVDEAGQYQTTELEKLAEVNLQCKSLRLIPKGFQNPHLQEHLTKFRNYNFYNLYAVDCNPKLSINEFKTVNKGRFVNINNTTLKVDNYYYEFSDIGYLKQTWK